MIDQELINKSSDIIERIAIGKVQAESVCDELVRLLNEMTYSYCDLIEDNAEMHREIARLRHSLANISYQIENIFNEEGEGVEE